MEFGPFPPLGWSVSRARDLHPDEGGCERRYYWRGPGSWRGWEVDEAHPAWLAYRLKGLVTLRAVIGIRVHEVARELVLHAAHGRPLPDYRQVLDRCWAELVALRSADRRKFLERPKKSPLLWESWYGYEDYLEREHLDACLASLYESDVLDEVGAAGAERLLLCDALDSVDLPLADGDHVTVWAAPDVAYLTDDVVTAVDWKTGGTRTPKASRASRCSNSWCPAWCEDECGGASTLSPSAT